MGIFNHFNWKKTAKISKQHQNQEYKPEINEQVVREETSSISISTKLKSEILNENNLVKEASVYNTRSIRVFISSTFRDMMEERDAMMSHTWPELRRLCRERHVELIEVDLRWGITEEQSTRKETLKLCLNEIRACRPYFIGLLGERYGWIPNEDSFTEDLIEEQPWLKALNCKSVTELEIFHGVLNNPEMAGRAFFYFRDPNYIKKVPKEKKADFLSETEAEAANQAKLKNLIRDTCAEKKIPLLETYCDPQSLAPIILEQLKVAIENHFPIEDNPEPLTRKASDHEAFAESRRQTYIGRKDYYEVFDHYIADNGKPIVLLGDSGSGKSALLANWVEHWRKSHPNDIIFQHYIGGTYDGAMHWDLMTRLMAEIKRWTEDPDEIPQINDDILRDFPLWISKARMKAEHMDIRFIIVLDALNQLEDKDHGRLLGWLPEHSFKGALRLIVSTLPGDTLEAIDKRTWSSFRIQPLTIDERRKLIVDYLLRYSKKLDVLRLNRISSEPAAANPLYLKILLDELRVTGTHEKLDERLDDYLTAKNIPDLLGKVLSRFQRDYDYDRSGLVSEALGLICAARRGLTEAELLQLLRPTHLPKLPLAIWSPLRAAMEEWLLIRGGILNFAHGFFRSAVELTFLPDQVKKTNYRLFLADYFEALPPTTRSCDELPWLLWHSKLINRLRNCLLNIDNFIKIEERDKNELLSYWVYLKEERSMGKQYSDSFKAWCLQNKTNIDRTSDTANCLGSFLNHVALYTEAEPLLYLSLQIDEGRFGRDHPKVAKSLNNLSNLLQITDQIEKAEPLFRRAINISENYYGKNHFMVAPILNNLSNLLQASNRFDEAVLLLRRVIEINKIKYGENHLRYGISLNNLGELLRLTNHFSEAETLMRRGIQILEENIGENNPQIASCLNNFALLLKDTNRLGEAESLMKRVLQIDETSFGKDHPNIARDLNNLALLLFATDRISEAESLYRRAIQIDENSIGKDHPNTATHISNFANLLTKTNRIDDAEALYRSSLQIHENSLGKDHPSVARDLNELALIYKDNNRLEEAESLFRRSLQINENSFGKNHPRIATQLSNLAELYRVTHRLSEAETLFRRAIEIFEKAYGRNHTVVAINIHNLALLLVETNHVSEAESLFRRAIQIVEQSLGRDHTDVATIMHHLTGLLISTNRIQEAEPLCRRVLEIYINYSRKNGQMHQSLKSSLTFYTDLLQDIGWSEEQIVAKLRGIAPELIQEKVQSEEKSITPEEARNIACDLYQQGDFKQAKEILSILLDNDFQPISIRIHLARIAIMTDRNSEVNEHTHQAWLLIKDASIYILARILWMKLYLIFIEKGKKLEKSVILGQIKCILQKEDAFMEWKMQPVLDHIKPKLTEQQYALLTALVAAMIDKQNMGKLNDFEEWRDVNAIEPL